MVFCVRGGHIILSRYAYFYARLSVAGRSSESSPELSESLPIADRPAHTAEVTSSGCSLKPKHVVAQIAHRRDRSNRI